MNVFKRGDRTLPNNYRPTSLASCFFKVLEHLVHSRIAPNIILQLDESQGGFRWSADVLVGSLVSMLSARSSSHTFVAFIDIQKEFDTSWVEGTLVRLFDAGVWGRMWSLMCNFLHGTQSQVRCGSSLSEPWLDSGMAQGRVLSPLLFNLLINSLIASVRQVAPGVQFCSSSLRVPGQLYADDLELSAECEFDLQVALDAVARWGRQWRFSFGIGPTKSAVMVFGPRRSIQPCSVHLGGDPLKIVMEYPSLGVILSPTLSHGLPTPVTWTLGEIAQCVAWCKTEGLSLRFASTLFTSYVLPSISWSSEFFISSPPALRVIDSALRRWGRFLGSPVGAVLLELRWPDALHLSTGRLLSQFGRLHAMPSHGRCPLPALVFQESLVVAGSWPSLCVEICASSDISLPGSFGISSGSSPSHVLSWFRSCVSPRLDQSLRDRLCAAVSSLSVFHVDLCSQSVNRGPDRAIYGCSSLPSHARFWGLSLPVGPRPLPRWSCSPPPRFFALMRALQCSFGRSGPLPF